MTAITPTAFLKHEEATPSGAVEHKKTKFLAYGSQSSPGISLDFLNLREEEMSTSVTHSQNYSYLIQSARILTWVNNHSSTGTMRHTPMGFLPYEKLSWLQFQFLLSLLSREQPRNKNAMEYRRSISVFKVNHQQTLILY